jgi:hypothetical protein
MGYRPVTLLPPLASRLAGVDLTSRAVLPCVPERAFAEIATLDGYPAWLGIVLAVSAADAAAGENGPAWWVELGARLGPLRRGKRVRMVRRLHEPPHRARFERDEADGRSHSPWVLTASLTPLPIGCELLMGLHYGGAAWLPLLDVVLAAEVRRAGGRLAARVA